MITPARILAALTLLTVTSCGQSPTDTTAGPARSDTSTASTTTEAGTDMPDRTDEPASSPDTPPASSRAIDAPVSDGTSEPTPGPTVTAAPSATTGVYAPPPGRYIYDVSGTIEPTGVTTTKEQAPLTSTDDIRVSDEPAAMRMTVITRDEGQDSSQEIVVAVTATEARLVRLSYRKKTGLDYSVNPDPPAMLARIPYSTGDTWEIAWNDPGTGISGVGTGTVERHETITTPAGSFDTVVLTVTQRLRGTVTGTLTVTSWIDPATGVQPRQHVVTDLQDATGASRSDTTRTLRKQST